MIHFLAGLPRSGSTLLANLLAQNPCHHCTPTNSLSELVGGVRSMWMNCEAFRAQGLGEISPRIRSSLAGMMRGFYAEEMAEGKTVFDKSRMWPSLIEVVEECLGRKTHVIVTVRDVRDIVASFEKLNRDNSITRHGNIPSSMKDRIELWCSASGVIGGPVTSVMDAFDRGLSDRIIVVPYSALTREPLRCMKKIHGLIGLPDFNYDVDHVNQTVVENDDVYGLPLHTIRSSIEPNDSTWRDVLRPELAEELSRSFSDVQVMASVPCVCRGDMINVLMSQMWQMATKEMTNADRSD